MPAQLTDLFALSRGGVHYRETLEELVKLVPILFHFGGEWLLDPNEFNAWGYRGHSDDRHTTDLGNVGANPSRAAGGIHFPWDVRVERLHVWHRNNNAGVLPWGWRMTKQQKTENSNTVTSVDMLRQVVGTGAGATAPNDYGNNRNQETNITTFADPILPAGQVLILGVESPTAVTTNRYVQVMSGLLVFSRAD